MIDIKLAVSTAMSNNDEILDYIAELEFAKIDILHLDVKDGRMSFPATFDSQGLRIIKNNTYLPIDAYLMIARPNKEIRKYIKARPDGIIVQYEHFFTERQLRRTLIKIQNSKIKSGLAIGPNIPVSYILPFVPYIDKLLILGKGDDGFDKAIFENAVLKIKDALELKRRFKNDLEIQFKGGVDFTNIERLANTGIDVAVAEEVVYDCFSRAYAIQNLRNPKSVLVKKNQK